jgi:hypothetical protein
MQLLCRLALVLAVLLSTGAVVRATVVEEVGLPDLVAGSSHVVMGRVVATRAAWDASGRRIMTHVTLEVEETLVGEAAPSLVVLRAGGVVGDVGQVVRGEPSLESGDRVLLFLERVGGTHRVTGMAQGCYVVFESFDGVTRVGRAASSLSLMGGAARVLMADRGVPSVPYGEFRTRVRRLAGRAP